MLLVWPRDRGTGVADVHAEVPKGGLGRDRGPGRGRGGTLISLLSSGGHTPVLLQRGRVNFGRGRGTLFLATGGRTYRFVTV